MMPFDIVSSNFIEEYDPRSRSLRTQPLSGYQAVPGRAGHTMVEWPDALSGRLQLVVFGGGAYAGGNSTSSLGSEVLLADVASISLQTFAWTLHAGAGEGPSPRKYAAAAVWRDNVMLVYGGELADGTVSTELWAYNLTARRWIGRMEPNPSLGESPPAVRSVALAVQGDFLILYGGYRSSITWGQAPSPPALASLLPSKPPGPSGSEAASPPTSPNATMPLQIPANSTGGSNSSSYNNSIGAGGLPPAPYAGPAVGPGPSQNPASSPVSGPSAGSGPSPVPSGSPGPGPAPSPSPGSISSPGLDAGVSPGPGANTGSNTSPGLNFSASPSPGAGPLSNPPAVGASPSPSPSSVSGPNPGPTPSPGLGPGAGPGPSPTPSPGPAPGPGSSPGSTPGPSPAAESGASPGPDQSPAAGPGPGLNAPPSPGPAQGSGPALGPNAGAPPGPADALIGSTNGPPPPRPAPSPAPGPGLGPGPVPAINMPPSPSPAFASPFSNALNPVPAPPPSPALGSVQDPNAVPFVGPPLSPPPSPAPAPGPGPMPSSITSPSTHPNPTPPPSPAAGAPPRPAFSPPPTPGADALPSPAPSPSPSPPAPSHGPNMPPAPSAGQPPNTMGNLPPGPALNTPPSLGLQPPYQGSNPPSPPSPAGSGQSPSPAPSGGSIQGQGPASGQSPALGPGAGRRRSLLQSSLPPPSPALPPPSPPTLISWKTYEPSKALLVVDLRLFPTFATWARAELNASLQNGTRAEASHMAGFDASLSVDEEPDALTIYASGGATRPGATALNTWRQWYARYSVPNVTQSLRALADNITTAMLGLTSSTVDGSSTAAASAGGAAPISLSLTLRRSGVFALQELIDAKPGTWVNADGAALDVTTPPGVSALPAGFAPSFVMSQAWTLGSDGTMVVYGGFREDDTTSFAAATSSQRMVLRWPSSTSQILSNATLKHNYFETSSSTTVMRTTHTLALQNLAPNGSYVGTSTGLISFGSTDITKVGRPDLGSAVIANTSSFSIFATCTAAYTTGSGGCLSVSAWGSEPAPQRDSYASAPLLASFKGDVYTGTGPFEVRTPLVLVYGGVALNGGPDPVRQTAGGGSGTTDVASQLKSVLSSCDTQGLLTSAQWTSTATCAWTALSTFLTVTGTSSTSTSGGGATSGGAAGGALGHHHRRRGALEHGTSHYHGREREPRERHLQYALPEAGTVGAANGGGGWWDLVDGAAGTQGYSDPWGAGSAPSEGKYGRSLAAAAGPTSTYFLTAEALVFQDPSAKPLALMSAVNEGPSLVYQEVNNLQGGNAPHSPGPRVGSSLAAVSGRGSILFGGATFGVSAMADGSVNASTEMVVTGDLHYMRLYVGGESVDAASEGVRACPEGADCAPAAPFAWTPLRALPTEAPLLLPTLSDLPTYTTNFSCPWGRTVRLEVVASADPMWQAGVRITTWAGTLLLKADLTPSAPGSSAGAKTSPPGTATAYGTVTLPPGLIQVWLTSRLGKGWTLDADYGAGDAPCCSASAAPGSNGSLCCPHVRLSSVECGIYLDGFGPGQALFDVGTQARNNVSFYQYRRVFGIAVQPTEAVLPTGDKAAYVQYPLGQRGLYLQTFEVQPLSSSPVPPPRHRHASVFMNNSALHQYYGTKGLLVVYGGSSTYSVSNNSSRLSDLWVFCLSNHTWIQLRPTGNTAPPALIDHAMATVESQLYIGGGEYYNPASGTFQQDSTIYLLDLGLPSLMWRRLAGGSNIYNTTSPTTGYYSLAYVPELNQLAFSTPTDLLLVPVTLRNSVDTPSTSSGSGTSGGSSAALQVSSSDLTLMLSALYSGDAVLLAAVALLRIDPGQPLLVNAAILLQGRYAAPGASAGQRRRLLGWHGTDGRGSTGSEGGSAERTAGGPAPDALAEAGGGARGLPRAAPGGLLFRLSVGERGRLSLVRDDPDREWGPRTSSSDERQHKDHEQHERQELELNEGSHQRVGVGNTDGGSGGGAPLRRLQAAAQPPPPPLSPGAAAGLSPAALLERYTANWPLTIVDCAGAGTALVIEAGGVTVQNFLFRNCVDTAVVVDSGSSSAVQIANCVFYNNTGTRGGALRVASGSSVSLTNCLFLANDAALGGAVYVDAGGTLGSASSVRFTRNGNGPGNTGGGALYAAGGGCIASLDGCTFESNGNANTSLSGGGLLLRLPACSATLSRCAFAANAAVSGGAVALAGVDSTLALTLSACNFTANKASTQGGALSVQASYGTVQLQDCRFEANAAGRRGGAVLTSSARNVTAVGCTFAGNTATLGAGGGWCAEKEGDIEIGSCTLYGNSALYGGGISLNRDLRVSMYDTVLYDNVARYAGAVDAQDCEAVDLVGCSFINNTATAAGALSISQASTGARITNCDFTSNAASSGTSSSDPCGRYGAGGGGAACLDVAGDIVVSESTFANNRATNGGAVWASQKCSGSSDGVCGNVRLYGTTMYGNRAVSGGGGAVFLYELDDLLLACATNGTDAAAIAAASLSGASADGGGGVCNGSWYNNSALYGDVMATTAASMRLVVPAGGSLPQYRSNDLLVVTVEVLDAFGQRISGGSPEAATTFTASAVTAQPTGALSQSATAGVANFSSLRVRNRPGNYSFYMSASGTFHALAAAVVSLGVRSCRVGEVTNPDDDLCTPCGAGFFSFNPRNTSCDVCPEHATCTPNGTEGYVVLPDDGYWRSGPFSPQIIACPNGDACTYDGFKRLSSMAGISARRQAALVAVILEMEGAGPGSANGTGTLYLNGSRSPVAVYRDLQCSEGYWGNVCGGCLPGYGRTGDATCSRCPSKFLNSLYYVLVSLVNVVIIAITIRAQLIRSRQKEPAGKAAAAQPAGVEPPPPPPLPQGSDEGFDNLQPVPGKALTSQGAAAGRREGSDTGGYDVGDGPGEGNAGVEVQARAAGVMVKVAENAGSLARPEDVKPALGRGGSGHPAAADGEDDGDMRDSELVTGTHSIVIKILVSYLQVASIVKGVALVWPSPVQWLLNLGDQISSGIAVMVSLDCSLPDNGVPKSIGRVVVAVMVPFILMLLSVPVWALLQRLRNAKRVQKGKLPLSMAAYLPPRLIMTAITIVFFTYPTVTDALLGIFSCPQLDSKPPTPYSAGLEAIGRFWAEDYNMRCYTGAHRLLMLILGVPGVLLFSCGVPALSAWFLSRHIAMLRNRKFYRAYGFLYSDYEDRCYAWESVIMLRKLGMVVVVVFLGPISVQVQLLVLLGIILLALAAQMLYDPYRCPRMDTLERLSLYGTTTIIYVALFFLLDVGNTWAMVLTVLLITFNACILCWFVLMLLREVARGVLRGIDTDDDGLVSAKDVQLALEELNARRPHLARALLALDAWARRNPVAGRLLSEAYPYGELTSPWIDEALEEEREVADDLEEQERERLAELAKQQQAEEEAEKEAQEAATRGVKASVESAEHEEEEEEEGLKQAGDEWATGLVGKEREHLQVVVLPQLANQSRPRSGLYAAATAAAGAGGAGPAVSVRAQADANGGGLEGSCDGALSGGSASTGRSSARRSRELVPPGGRAVAAGGDEARPRPSGKRGTGDGGGGGVSRPGSGRSGRGGKVAPAPAAAGRVTSTDGSNGECSDRPVSAVRSSPRCWPSEKHPESAADVGSGSVSAAAAAQSPVQCLPRPISARRSAEANLRGSHGGGERSGACGDEVEDIKSPHSPSFCDSPRTTSSPAPINSTPGRLFSASEKSPLPPRPVPVLRLMGHSATAAAGVTGGGGGAGAGGASRPTSANLRAQPPQVLQAASATMASPSLSWGAPQAASMGGDRPPSAAWRVAVRSAPTTAQGASDAASASSDPQLAAATSASQQPGAAAPVLASTHTGGERTHGSVLLGSSSPPVVTLPGLGQGGGAAGGASLRAGRNASVPNVEL